MVEKAHFLIANTIFLGSKAVKLVSDGFSGTMFIIVKRTSELFCLNINEGGVVSNFESTGLRVSDVTCSSDYCCGYQLDGQTHCFRKFTCRPGSFPSINKVNT